MQQTVSWQESVRFPVAPLAQCGRPRPVAAVIKPAQQRRDLDQIQQSRLVRKLELVPRWLRKVNGASRTRGLHEQGLDYITSHWDKASAGLGRARRRRHPDTPENVFNWKLISFSFLFMGDRIR